MRFGPNIAENSIAFDEYLPNVRHQTASVPESVSLFYPSTHYLIVLLVLVYCPKVSGAEHLGFPFDGKIFMGDNPAILYQSQLLHDLLLTIVNEGGGSWSVNGDDCVNLVAQFGPNEIVGVGVPDGEDAADGKVSIDD